MLFYKLVKNSVKIILSLIYRVEIEGKENIPKEGKAVVCSNHFSLMDPVFIGAFLPRRINYMAKEELFSNSLFSLILKNLGVFPVKRGGNDISAIKTAMKLLNSDEIMGIFPEGTRSEPGETLDAKPGTAMIATRTKSPIIPVAIIGNYKIFRKMKMRIGSPIELSDYYGQKISTDEYQILSQDILNEIRKLID